MKILVTSLPDIRKIHPQRPHHLLKNLSRNHEITVLCVNAWWLREIQDEYLKSIVENVELYYLTESKLNAIVQETLSFKNLRRLSENHDFDIHISFNSLIMGYTAKKILKIPTVFDVCDDIIRWIDISPRVPSLLKPVGRSFGYFMFKKFVKISEKVTYSADFLRRSFALPESKSSLVPNGVDLNLFYKRTGEIRKQLSIPEDVFIIGFVGFLGDWVDMKSVFKVLKIIRNQLKIKMLIVGNGSRFTEFNELSKRYGIRDLVIFTGEIPYLKVPEYISAMDVCLLPFDKSAVSQSALPLKLFEYMACEKPVISTPLPTIRDTVGDKLFFVSDATGLKEAILRLYHDEQLRRELGRKGRNFVKQNYNWDTIAKKFEMILLRESES